MFRYRVFIRHYDCNAEQVREYDADNIVQAERMAHAEFADTDYCIITHSHRV